MSQMLKSSGAMGIATLSSRVLGMVREILYAKFMGDSWVAGAFQMAYMIPNLFRRLLGEGALTAAFIPIFKEKERREGEKAMWHAANAVLSGLVIAASAIIGLCLLGVSLALHYFDFTTDTRLMLELLRLMFPYMLLVCVAAVFMGMLNARGYFFIPALGATMLNVVMIATVLWIAPRFGPTLQHQIFGLAIGVLLAGFAQALFQWPSLRREGFRWRWVKPWGNETVRTTVRKMIPGMLGVAAFQLNVLLTQGMAFAVDSQIVASFGYAVRLMELPQGVFGISLATYLLPTLAGLAADKNFAQFRSTLREGISYLVFVNWIASVLLTVLAVPIVRLLFERGEFDAESTARAGFALACLAPGLIAFSLVNILARAFYALGDTTTPMKISAVCLGLNLVFAFGLIPSFKQGGLGIANTMSACFNVWLLFYALRRKLSPLDLSETKREIWTMAGAGLVAGQCAWFAFRGWETWVGHENLVERIGSVFCPAAIGGLIYGGLLVWLKVPAAIDFWELFLQKIRRRKDREEGQ
jgi:putative peptidoglycan lipid II flippase